MADDAQIERAINREVAGALAVTPHGGSVFTIAPRSVGEVMEFAKMMAISGICVRPMFRGNPGACLAVALQAMKIGADPFAVANKAYEVNGQLAYESQLVHAIVNTSPALTRGLDATFSGEGASRKCLVTGEIKGRGQREYESPKFSEITPKNSPLWKTDPDQQLFYYSTRAWARRWVPEVLLGIYTPEELTPTIDLTPAPEPRREDFIAPPIEHDDAPVYTVVDLDGVEHEFREAETAEAALIAVLEEAAKMGLSRLDGAWDSNIAGRAVDMRWVGAPGSPQVPDSIRARYGELSTMLQMSLQATEKPGGASPARETAPPASTAPAAAPPPPAPPETPADSALEERFTADPTSPAAASAATPASSAPADTPASGKTPPSGNGPTATNTASPSDDSNLAIAPPLRRGVPDWRTWAIALFLPKVRQATDTAALAFLVGDNDANLTAARAALDKADRESMEAAISKRFGELDNAP